MEIIVHRRNRVEELRDTPAHFGVEVDIRSHDDTLIIHHDPFAPGEPFECWIAEYRHGTLILNVKEEGLEERVLAIMAEHKIERFFFLDQSFPFLLRTARRGERRCAVRISEYETVETALSLAPLIDWTWLDCFTRFPLDRDQSVTLAASGLKTCVVSPELHGRSVEEIAEMRSILETIGMSPDAVCTKRPDLWA